MEIPNGKSSAKNCSCYLKSDLLQSESMPTQHPILHPDYILKCVSVLHLTEVYHRESRGLTGRPIHIAGHYPRHHHLSPKLLPRTR